MEWINQLLEAHEELKNQAQIDPWFNSQMKQTEHNLSETLPSYIEQKRIEDTKTAELAQQYVLC